MLAHRVIIKSSQSDDLLGYGGIALIHLNRIEPGTKGQSTCDTDRRVATVCAQLQHSQRGIVRNEAVQNFT